MKKAFIMDGSNLLYRFYYGFDPLTKNKFNQNINGFFGFFKTLIYHLRDNPDYVYVVWEGGNQKRKELSPIYKKDRKIPTDNFRWQAQQLHSNLRKIGIESTFFKGYEADDGIGNIKRILQEKHGNDIQITIFSSDKDFCQLLDDNTIINNPGKKKIITKESFIKDFGFSPENMIDYLALVGDTSDNIVGVKGIGEKTGKKLLSKYKSLSNLFKNIDEIENEKLKQKLLKNKTLLKKNFRLVKLFFISSVKKEDLVELKKKKEWNKENFLCIINDLEFHSLDNFIKKLFN